MEKTKTKWKMLLVEQIKTRTIAWQKIITKYFKNSKQYFVSRLEFPVNIIEQAGNS